MDMKRKLREFFTLKRHANDGFTLVELIVVIAIVAILGGVAVPAYSGYIEKTRITADKQLLADVNKAFISACMVNGEDNFNRGDVSKSVTLNEGEIPEGFTTNKNILDSFFNEFYEGGKFEVATKLEYNAQTGMFTAPELDDGGNAGGIFTQIFGSIDGIDGLVTLLNNSTFGDIGAEGLMERVDIVTGLAAGMCEANENFLASLAGSLGSLQSALGMDDETFGTYMYGLIEEKAAQLNPEDPTAAYDAARYEIMANYAVLNAAQNTIGKSESEIISNLKGGVSVQDIKNMMDKNAAASTQQEGMANAAMMYAMYTAYANGLPEGDEKTQAMSIIEANDISTFVTTMANQESQQYTGFQAYLDTDQATKDVNGYLSAMNIINQSANGNQEAVSSLLVNGYGDPDLVAALQGLMG